MTLHDETRRVYQMLLQLRFCTTLLDERGDVFIKCNWPFPFVCCNMTLHDERVVGFN